MVANSVTVTEQAYEHPRSWSSMLYHPHADHTASSDCSTGSPDDTSIVASAPVAKPKRVRRKRKATHTIRKEEIAHLKEEAAELEQQLVQLRTKATRRQDTRSFTECKQETQRLQDAVDRQRLRLAQYQGWFSHYMSLQECIPAQMYFSLGSNPEQRRQYLFSCRDAKLKAAKKFLRQRYTFLNPHRRFREEHRYEGPSGNFHASRCSVRHFVNVSSVRQVYDVLVYLLRNMEISMSEAMGALTIREDDDSGDDELWQSKLVIKTHFGVDVESNTITLPIFTAHDNKMEGDKQHGIILVEFVDQDELYPYQTHQRIRRDINVVFDFSSYYRPTKDGQELVVVLKRWSHCTLHRPDFAISPAAWRGITKHIGRWGEALLAEMYKWLYNDVVV